MGTDKVAAERVKPIRPKIGNSGLDGVSASPAYEPAVDDQVDAWTRGFRSVSLCPPSLEDTLEETLEAWDRGNATALRE